MISIFIPGKFPPNNVATIKKSQNFIINPAMINVVSSCAQETPFILS